MLSTQLVMALRGARLAGKNGGIKSFDRFYTDVHSSEQAGVLCIVGYNHHHHQFATRVLMLPYHGNALFS